MVLRWCLSGVSVVSQWCLGSVPVVFQRCLSGAPVVIQWCLKGLFRGVFGQKVVIVVFVFVANGNVVVACSGMI